MTDDDAVTAALTDRGPAPTPAPVVLEEGGLIGDIGNIIAVGSLLLPPLPLTGDRCNGDEVGGGGGASAIALPDVGCIETILL